MRLLKPCFILIIVFVARYVFSASIKGFEPAYAGELIIFYTHTDPVSKTVKEAFRLEIDARGNFFSEINNREVLFTFADFGVYRGLLFLEPEKSVTLYLPPRKDKSLADQKNPYFSVFSTWLKTGESSGENLNKLVSAFDALYYQLSDKYFNQLYVRRSKAYLDTVTNILIKEFDNIKNPVFKNHFILKIKLLEGDVFRQYREKIFEKISLSPPFPWLHPAFLEILDPVFTNRLSFEARSIKGDQIKKAVAQNDILFLKKFFEENYRTSDPITSIILLKVLYDAFYTGDFSREAILSMISSGYFSNHQNNSIRKFSAESLKKLRFLLPGTSAPTICLKNITGETICTDLLIKNYLYVFFADIDIPVCQEQLKYLKSLNEKFRGKIEIAIIILPTELEKLKTFVKNSQIPGTILIEETPVKFSKLFGVRSFPTCFLLNKNHNVVLAPAKTPLDGFEQQFASILQAERINLLRKNVK